MKNYPSNKVTRYGKHLIRVLSVDMDANVACAGNSLHQVNGINVGTGRPVVLFASDKNITQFLDKPLKTRLGF